MSFRSDSLAQSNAILVLASLALVSTQHFLSLDEDESGANQSLLQHTGQNEWLAMVIDTLLCLLDCNYEPRRQIFTWYQQVITNIDHSDVYSIWPIYSIQYDY